MILSLLMNKWFKCVWFKKFYGIYLGLSKLFSWSDAQLNELDTPVNDPETYWVSSLFLFSCLVIIRQNKKPAAKRNESAKNLDLVFCLVFDSNLFIYWIKTRPGTGVDKWKILLKENVSQHQ